MMNGYFLMRVAYVFVCWGILSEAMEVFPEADTDSRTRFVPILSGLMLFLLPLGLDYWNHKPRNANDIRRRKIGVMVPVFIFCLYLIFIIIDKEAINSFLLIPAVKFTLWLSSASFVGLAFMDYLSYSSDEEETARTETRDAHRASVIDNRQKKSEKKQFYQSIRTQGHILKTTANGRKTKGKRNGGKKR